MTDEVVRSEVLLDTYRDSVELMRVAAEIERLPGVLRAALLAATPANRDLLAKSGLLDQPAESARPSDLVIAVAARDDAAARAALARATALLAAPGPATPGAAAEKAPSTIAAGAAGLPEANLAIISTPGPYATAEALKALKRGLHVFLFSDNVPVEEEIELKRLAAKKHLLVMGPDCGTAILDGVPLGFANVVRRGPIALVGASGTGLQEVLCQIDRAGEGVSQVIGVGGHDLSERVGGVMMLAAIERQAADPDTSVLVLVSKPPAPAVARRVLDAARASGKPVVVCFLGGDPAAIRASGAHPAATLAEAARLAVALAHGAAASEGGPVGPGRGSDTGADTQAAGAADGAPAAAAGLAASQWAIRGLYSGGTLCAEAELVVARVLGGRAAEAGHTLVDLGDDEYTVGRPHPMIDFRLRNERIAAAALDPATAVILLDVVLGYGSHPDPAGALVPALQEARARAASAGRSVLVIASVCGTASDPQDLVRQERQLRDAGVRLARSNAEAARQAALAVRDTGHGGGSRR